MRFPHFLAFSCGASHLTSVHLKMNASGRCDLEDFNIETVDFSSSDPLLWLKAVSDRLESTVSSKAGDIPAGFVIPGHVALAKYLKIPQTSPGKRQRIVAFEARQNIPYPFDEVTWDHSVVAEDDLDFDVMIGAARTEIVEALGRYSKDFKINMRSVEPSTTALINGYRFNYPDVLDCTLLISIGCKSTELVYLDRSRYHSRNIPFGGQSISIEIAETLGMPMYDAERIKQSAILGEPLSTEEYSAFEASKQNFIRRLLTEVSRTSAVMKRQGYDFEVKKCLLTGGGGVLPDLSDTLSTRLSVPVEQYDPLRKIHVADEELRERVLQKSMFLADAIGHALGQFLPDAVRIDLMPRSLVWQRTFKRQQPFYIVAGLVACAAVGLPVFSTALKINSYQHEIDNLDSQIRPLSQLNKDIHDRKRQIERITEVIEKSSQAAELRSSWIRLLGDFQGRLFAVEDVWLDKMELVRPEAAPVLGNRHARVKKEDTRTTLRLEGRLIDVRNPMTSVSPDSYHRVKALLESFRDSRYVASLEDERFDYSVPGMLKFDFVLVMNPEVRL